MKKTLLACLGLLSVLSWVVIPPALALKTVDFVDPEKYQGKYYEIALIPYFFEKQCAKNGFAEYTLLPDKKGTVFKDYFQCEKNNGKLDQKEGRVRVVNEETNAVLSVTFVKSLMWHYWFGDNYWIIDRGPNYEYTVVGNPSLKYGWILAREPQMSKETLTSIRTVLEDNGYDACQLEMMPQDGSDVTEFVSLCEYLAPQ